MTSNLDQAAPVVQATEARGPGRPRLLDIPEETRHCHEHGMTTFRRWRNGKTRHGKQQYLWGCLICHNTKNKAQQARSRASETEIA